MIMFIIIAVAEDAVRYTWLCPTYSFVNCIDVGLMNLGQKLVVCLHQVNQSGCEL